MSSEKRCGDVEPNNESIKTIQSWSGGKDSTASIILEHIYGLPKSRIVFVEVMFDHSRGISGELPEHINFVKNVAIPKFKGWGYQVDIIQSDSDYIQEFYHVITRSKIPERNGKYAGFFIGSMCAGNDRLKMRPLRKYEKDHVNCKWILGIASDEPKRLQRLKINQRSLLSDYGYTEKMAYDLCQQHELLSPIYKTNQRGGCWFCPNQSVDGFARLQKKYPELYGELMKMSHEENLASQNFKYGITFDDVDRYVNKINGQMRFYDNE